MFKFQLHTQRAETATVPKRDRCMSAVDMLLCEQSLDCKFYDDFRLQLECDYTVIIWWVKYFQVTDCMTRLRKVQSMHTAVINIPP